jgi:hypothetical protein
MRFVITSGTSIREIVDQRPDAQSAYKRVMDVVSTRCPSVRIFDQDGQIASLTSYVAWRTRKASRRPKARRLPTGR